MTPKYFYSDDMNHHYFHQSISAEDGITFQKACAKYLPLTDRSCLITDNYSNFGISLVVNVLLNSL